MYTYRATLVSVEIPLLAPASIATTIKSTLPAIIANRNGSKFVAIYVSFPTLLYINLIPTMFRCPILRSRAMSNKMSILDITPRKL